MSAKYFIDTNVFVYSFDPRDSKKQARALSLIASALESGTGIISTQVVQEFLNVATQKFKTPLKREDSRAYLNKVLNPLCHIYPDLRCTKLLANPGGNPLLFYDPHPRSRSSWSDVRPCTR
jgi:predicted nucleic acid-binding protein